jgi:putative transposase
MPRPLRAAVGGLVYHILNRSNARLTLFEEADDYEAFIRVLSDAVGRVPVRLLSYCVMPNHFHLIVWPHADGDLSRFMRWLTLTHTQRWHAHHQTAGGGHVYQGRFKSFPVQDDGHYFTACRYVERNPVRSGLVKRAEQWRWSSLAKNPSSDAPRLSAGPIAKPGDWLERVNAALSPAEEEAVRRGILRGQPLGEPKWQARMAAKLGLQSTFRDRGRPRRQEEAG